MKSLISGELKSEGSHKTFLNGIFMNAEREGNPR